MQKGQVAGTVTNEAGAPLAGVEIRIGQSMGGGIMTNAPMATTDANGRFHFHFQERNRRPFFLLCQASGPKGTVHETRVLHFPPLLEGAEVHLEVPIVCKPVEPGTIRGTTLPVIQDAAEEDKIAVIQLINEAGTINEYPLHSLQTEKRPEGQTFRVCLAPGNYEIMVIRGRCYGDQASSAGIIKVMKVEVKSGETQDLVLTEGS